MADVRFVSSTSEILREENIVTGGSSSMNVILSLASEMTGGSLRAITSIVSSREEGEYAPVGDTTTGEK